MSLAYQDLSLNDRNDILSFTYGAGIRSSALSFPTLYSWNFSKSTQWAVWNDFLIIRTRIRNHLVYYFPIGDGDIVPLIEILKKEAALEGQNFEMLGPVEYMKTTLETHGLIEEFEIVNVRHRAEYVYLHCALATLSGKKLQAKRNKLNKFRAMYPDYRYEELTPINVPQCIELENEWVREHKEEAFTVNLEREAIIRALTHLHQLGLIGGVIYIQDDLLIAFTYGSAIHADTFSVNVEKAKVNYEEAYAMINYEFARHLPEHYIYINREEDMGIENLRKAKLSYRPTFLLEMGYARLISR